MQDDQAGPIGDALQSGQAMPFRLLADDGSVHVFPPQTDGRVMSGVIGRYNAALEKQQARAGSASSLPPSPRDPAPSSAPTPVASDLGPNSGLNAAHHGACLVNVNEFMKAHLADARTLAAMAPPGVAPQEILALSADETGYGGPKGQAGHGNYFGLHNKDTGSFPGQIGTYVAVRPPFAKTPIFPQATGYLDSGRAFVSREAPYLAAQDLSNVDNFFNTIHGHGYAVPSANKDYLNKMRNVYGLFGNCLRRGSQ